MYELIIIGGGPAGMTAAVYAARKKRHTLLMTEKFGGQPVETRDVENYMGFQYITGLELMKKFEEQMKRYNIEKKLAVVHRLTKKNGCFGVQAQDQKYEAKSVIIASGKNSRRLDVPGEKEFLGKGVSYCATCDGPIFEGQDVAVIGGGNSALQAALELSRIARKVYLISRSGLIGEPVIIDKIEAQPNLQLMSGYIPQKIKGNQLVESIVIQAIDKQENKEIPLNGIFVEIGLTPNSDFARDLVKTNEKGEIIVNCSCQTNVPGVFAAGDVTNIPEKQILIAAGEGAKAAIGANDYLGTIS